MITLPSNSTILRIAAVALMGLGAVQTADAAVGRDWVLRNPTPIGEDLNALAYGAANRYVAVGGHGLIRTSDDGGITWITRVPNPPPLPAPQVAPLQELRDVIWTGSQFIAVGTDSVVMTSPDGISWATRYALGKDDFNAVIWTGALMIAVGHDGKLGSSQASASGATWVRHVTGVTDALTDVVWTGNTAFAVSAKNILTGQATAATSAVKWTKVAFTGIDPLVDPLHSFARSGGFALSTAGATPKVFTSSSASAWVQSSATPASPLKMRANAVNKFIGVGKVGEVWTSDQSVWTNFSTGQGDDLRGAIAAPSTFDFIVCGDAGKVLTTPTPTAWVSRGSTGPTDDLTGVATNGTAFVAVGKNVSVTSPDGTTWTRHVQSNDMRSVTFRAGSYYAAGTAIWSSPDGITWTERLSAGAAMATFNRVHSTGSTLYAVGYNLTTPVIRSSVDGITWTNHVLPTGSVGRLHGVGSLFNAIIAVGDAGLVIRSMDNGTTWTKVKVALATGEKFTDVAYHAGLYVAATNLSSLWTSANGLVWVKRVTPSLTLPSLLGYNRVVAVPGVGGEALALSGAGYITSSFSAQEWITRSSITGQSLADGVIGGGVLVAVGHSGIIISSSGGAPARPTVSFAATSSAISESAGSTVLTVNLTPASESRVSMLYSVTGNSAAPADYTNVSLPKPLTLTFEPGVTSRTINLALKDDTLDEVDETAAFLLGSPTGDAAIGVNRQHILTILDNDTLPAFTTHPLSQLVPVGAVVNLSASGNASDVGAARLTAQWKKGASTPAELMSGPLVVGAGVSPAVSTTAMIPVSLAVTATAAVTNVVTCASTAQLAVNMPVVFSAGIGVLTGNRIYYVQSIASPATFRVSQVSGGAAINLTAAAPASAMFVSTAMSTLTVNLTNSTAVTNVLTAISASGLTVRQSIRLSGSLGGLNSAVTYFIAALKSPTTFTVSATPGGAVIPLTTGAGSITGTVFSQPKVLPARGAQLTSAGLYAVELKNVVGKKLSNLAMLGVVDTTPITTIGSTGTTTTLIAKASGAGLTFQWRKGGQLLGNSFDGRVAGVNTLKLVIKGLSAADVDSYDCVVTQTTPTGVNTLVASPTSLGLIESTPTITSPSMPATTVGQPYSFVPVATQFPSSWIVAGLPTGLSFNPLTGAITGAVRQNVANAVVTLTAINTIGSGPPVDLTLNISPLPAPAVGDFQALINRNPINGDIGGYLQINSAATSVFTGSLHMGRAHVPVMGAFDFNPTGPVLTAVFDVPTVAGLPPSALQITITPGNPVATRIVVLQSNPSASVTSFAWPNVWTAGTATNRSGNYNFKFGNSTQQDQTKPQGNGFGRMVLAADGTATVTGKIADGTAYSFTGFIGPVGELAFYASSEFPSADTSAPLNSVMGIISINEVPAANAPALPYNNNFMSSSPSLAMTWMKGADTRTPVATQNIARVYKDGFSAPLVLTVDGGRYTIPVPAPALPANINRFLAIPATNLTNARLAFAHHASSSLITATPDIILSIAAVDASPVLTIPSGVANPQSTNVTIDNATGVFSGTFIQEAPLRAANFYGIVIRQGGNPIDSAGSTTQTRGFGFFLLNEVPSPDWTVLDLTPIHSGSVIFRRNP
jgi:Calx-beta domain